MITPLLRKSLEKQGYRLIGSHSGVKLCRWTKVRTGVSMVQGWDQLWYQSGQRYQIIFKTRYIYNFKLLKLQKIIID